MNKKEFLISKITKIEWGLFSNVQNRGGKASCQENPKTFEIIRTANFRSWSEATLESYLHDLKGAKKTGRNLMTEKYARMEDLIPPLNPEALPLIDKIVEMECSWLVELAEKSPQLKLTRPIYSSQDTPEVVSSETYLRGELETYSKKTLELYYKDLVDMHQKNINKMEVIFNNVLEKFNSNPPESK